MICGFKNNVHLISFQRNARKAYTYDTSHLTENTLQVLHSAGKLKDHRSSAVADKIMMICLHRSNLYEKKIKKMEDNLSLQGDQYNC